MAFCHLALCPLSNCTIAKQLWPSQVDNFPAATHGLRDRLYFQKRVSFFGPQLCIALVRAPHKTGPDFDSLFVQKAETMVGHFRGRDLGPNMHKESFICISFAKNRLWLTIVVFCFYCEIVRPEPSLSSQKESACLGRGSDPWVASNSFSTC